jgi:hypothetical protein
MGTWKNHRESHMEIVDINGFYMENPLKVIYIG